MITLGWESIAALLLNLEQAEAAIYRHQAHVEVMRAEHEKNTALFDRWQPEMSLAMERLLNVNARLGAIADVPPAYQELDDLTQKHPEVLMNKRVLEAQILIVMQRYEDCLRAFQSSPTDDALIMRTYEAFESDRAQCARQISVWLSELVRFRGSV